MIFVRFLAGCVILIKGMLDNWIFMIFGIVALFKARKRDPFGGHLILGFLLELLTYVGFMGSLKRDPIRYGDEVTGMIMNFAALIVLLGLFTFGCHYLKKEATRKYGDGEPYDEKAEEAKARAMDGRRP